MEEALAPICVIHLIWPESSILTILGPVTLLVILESPKENPAKFELPAAEGWGDNIQTRFMDRRNDDNKMIVMASLTTVLVSFDRRKRSYQAGRKKIR